MNNRHTRKLFLILLISIFNNYPAFSQESTQPAVQKINQEKGLSDNDVQCIYKDHNNFMWIGTKSGLNRIDGSTISIFKNIPGDSRSISDNIIKCISEDYSGLLWIGTQHGLNSFDPEMGTFTVISPENNSNFKTQAILSIAIDKQGRLFMATPSGISIYNQKLNKISSLEIPGENSEKLLNNNITQIAFDNKGMLYITTFNGLWSYNDEDSKFIHVISEKNDPSFTRLFTTFIIDHNGKLWIGTWDKGVKEFDPVMKTILTHQLPGNIDFNVRCLTEVSGPEKNYFILVNGNKLSYDTQRKKFIGQLSDGDDDLTATTLFTSRDNWVWMGTHSGIAFYNPYKTLMIHRLFAKPITGQDVSLLEWKHNILVSGSGGYFLKEYDDKLHEKGSYGDAPAQENISCLTCQVSGPEALKCGTTHGIADINLSTGEIRFHQLKDTSGKRSNFNFITFLLKDSYKKWWIFPWRNGIWVTDSSTTLTKQLFNNFISQYDIPKPLVIAAACEDKNKNIWFGDYDEGVIFYNRKTNRFSKPFINFFGPRYSISQIVYDADYCYSFTGTSLLVWNVDSQALRVVRLSPITDKVITSVALDSSKHIWMSTQNGLFSYDLKTKTYRHFTTSDGLLSNEMNGTLYCLSNGTMLFGCPKYLTAFHPVEMLKSIDNAPGLVLTEVMIDGKPFRFNPKKKEYFNHNVHNFIFRWAITDFTDPLNNRYFYKLEGIDKEWRSIGKTGEVEFANLSPGSYHLLLKGKNSHGIDAREILNLQFDIESPFWQSWWFFVLLFCGVAAFFYSLYRYRLTQILKIEKLRNSISLNLHDDIGSTLSSISILSDMALHREKDDEAGSMLKEIKENSLAMMERMDDIVWSINPKNDTLENLLIRIKTFAAKLFEAKEINYKIMISDQIGDIHLDMAHRQHIYLIMKEAINNMVKYSKCSEAEIIVAFKASELTIILKDNGTGFDPAKTLQGNGLSNMQKRAKEINATIDITSAVGSGTKISLIAKIK